MPRPHRRPRAAGARGRGGRRARLPRPGRLDGPRHAGGGAGGGGRGAGRGGRRAGRARARRRRGARPPARPSRRARRADGLLPVQQRGRRRALGAARARRGARGHRRLGRAPRQRDGGDLLRRRLGAVRVAPPGRALSRRHGRARGARRGAGRGRERQRPAAGRHGRPRLRLRLRARGRAGGARVPPAAPADRRRAGRRGDRPARPHVADRAGLPRPGRPRRRAGRGGLPRAGSSSCWRAATRCCTCRWPTWPSSRRSPGCPRASTRTPSASTRRSRCGRSSAPRSRRRCWRTRPVAR